MKSNKATLQRIDLMKTQLRGVRNAILDASRKGQTAEVARLSAQAIKLNRAILEAEGLATFA
jgi:hypothetical protein